jgi:hypothetical protein
MSTMTSFAALKNVIDGRQFKAQYGEMTLTATSVQWTGVKKGANLAPLMSASYYPVDDREDPDRVRTSVRLPLETHADIEIIAKLWNELDRALGRKRTKKWKPASVIERLVTVGIDGFWAQIGGRPSTQEGRDDFARKALERLKKSSGK